MSETPTPRSIAAHQEACAKKFEAHKLSHLFLAACELERELTAERAARERAEAENATLRGLLGNSGKPCAHCGLPVERWGECALGFPGCARADDAQLSDLFAIGAALAEAEAERDALAEAWREYLSAEQIIEQAAFGDNYTDAARARARQQRAIGQARAALAALERGDGKDGSER